MMLGFDLMQHKFKCLMPLYTFTFSDEYWFWYFNAIADNAQVEVVALSSYEEKEEQFKEQVPCLCLGHTS